MTDEAPHRTRTGRTLTDEEIETLADEVAEEEYDVEVLKKRRRGRAPMGSGRQTVSEPP